ncbi:MAG TPA: hypothetical protein VHM25_10100 [Polyangiaceae bacterium]|jgi:hypothetical protein|nr:hypothetical protein [Polyangiaceae bacterium]
MFLVSKNRPMGVPAFSAAAAITCLSALGLFACSASDVPAGSGGSGPVTAAGHGNGTAGSSPLGTGGSSPVGSGGQGTVFPTAGSGGTAPLGSAGAPVTGGSGPQGGTGSSSGGSGSGQGGAAHVRDHCLEGYDPDPTDATMVDGPVEFTKSNQVDLTVQPAVLDWFKARVWEQAHFQWHNIRRCKTGGATADAAGGGVNPCKTNPELIPANQENQGPGDGLEFLAMHRHMIQSLKQLWPKHTEQFEGWEHFPTKASDVPKQWQADWSAWMSDVATNGAKADDPASHMNEAGFESEGAFGQWIQSTSKLHGALHFKWVRPNNSEHGLGNQFANIDNYMFWKMHGWIDKVWDRYRAAKGKKPTDQDIKDAVLAQCRQMDQLAVIVKPDLGSTTCTPAAKESGVFVDTIRPIFESSTNKCTGCHGRVGPDANMTLGGSECVKSSDIVKALVSKASIGGGQFKLIEPGNADKSWLYLKVTGKAATAGCTATGGGTCSTETMPRGGGVTLTQAEQDALKKWINDGAVAPK